MNLLSRTFFLAVSLFLNSVLASEGRAAATHLARVEVEMGWMGPSGKFESEVDRTLDFRLDWNSKKCEVEFKGVFYYCILDVEGDLRDRDGNVLMKQLPVAHFGYKSLDALMLALGRESDGLKQVIARLVKDSSSLREKGFKLPFYTCEACTRTGERVPVWNAYDSYVRRVLEVPAPVFQAKKLVLSMKIHKMRALAGAFNIIGRTNADSYIPEMR